MGAILDRSKKLPRFIGEKSMLMRKLQAKGKVLKITLNGSCMMVFKKFAGQLIYALGPLPQPVKEFDNLLASEKLCQFFSLKISRAVWNHFTSKIHALVKYSRRRSILGILHFSI